MRVTGNGCHLIGTEGSSPPLPYIEVSEGTGNALIRQKLAIEVTGEDSAPEPEPKKANKKAPEPKAPEPKVETPPPPPPPASEPEKAPEHTEDRAETIVHALDLVEGEPTVEAVAEITGLTDLTAEELAAAVAAHAAANA